MILYNLDSTLIMIVLVFSILALHKVSTYVFNVFECLIDAMLNDLEKSLIKTSLRNKEIKLYT